MSEKTTQSDRPPVLKIALWFIGGLAVVAIIAMVIREWTVSSQKKAHHEKVIRGTGEAAKAERERKARELKQLGVEKAIRAYGEPAKKWAADGGAAVD